MENEKGILVFASHDLKEDVEMVKEYYPNIFATYWTEDFEKCLRDNFGKFHIMAITCRQDSCRRGLFELAKESGFQGKIYALIPSSGDDDTDFAWPSEHICLQERFRCFVYNQMNP